MICTHCIGSTDEIILHVASWPERPTERVRRGQLSVQPLCATCFALVVTGVDAHKRKRSRAAIKA